MRVFRNLFVILPSQREFSIIYIYTLLNMRHLHIQCLSLLAVMTCLLTACTDTKKQETKAAVAVSAIVVGGDTHTGSCEYVGTVVERSGTSLSFEVPGKVMKLMVDNGDPVRKGQLLAVIDPTSLREAHRATLATLKQAEDACKRFEPLHRQGTISDIKWMDLQTKLEQAQTAEQLARTQLSHTQLTAPFSGVISERPAEQGMNVMAGQPIYHLVDIAGVDVKVSVPEAEVSAIRIGSKASVKVSAVGGRSYMAIVKEKGVVANAVSHTYDVKLAISGSDGKLMPGMVCSVWLHAGASDVKDEATTSSVQISVPTNAVKLDADNRRFVWMVVAGKAKRQYVTIGDFIPGGVSITDGLRPGDCIITDGSQKVSEGMKVKVNK